MHTAFNICPYHDSCLYHACAKETRHEIDTVVKTSVTAHEILGSVFSIPLATGTIKDMVNRLSGALSETYERICRQLIALGLIH